MSVLTTVNPATGKRNDTRSGPGASVWTRDPRRGIAVARRTRSGASE